MKKINIYFENHPKLKRIVKLLGVVAIVFSFLLNALIIASLIIQANKPKESVALAYGDYKTPYSKQAIEQRFAVYYGYGDFLSLEFAEETYELLINPDITNLGNTGLDYEDFLAGTPIIINNPDMLFGIMDSTGQVINWDNNYTFVFLRVEKLVEYNYPVYKLSFQMKHTNTNHYKYEFTYARYSSYNDNNDLIFWNWSSCATLSRSYDNGSTFSDYSMPATSFNFYWSIAKGNPYNWIGTGNPNYTMYWNEGYDAGYENGYYNGENAGAEAGYQDGYYDGLQAGQDGDSTMFTLIAQAFHAVASILDIQILPNLSLGLLLFTPLIVTIIIVVVKMVKG